MEKDLRTILAAVAAVVVLAASATMALSGAPRNFVAHLDGDSVAPPVDTDAQGEATFRLSADGTQLSYRIIVANIENPTMAGIHLGGLCPMVASLYMPDEPPQGRFDGVLAEGTITAADLMGPLAGRSLQDLVNEIDAGNAVVHVCTAQHMPEISGPIQ